MSFSVSYIYQIQDKYSKKLEKINKITEKFRKNIDLNKRKMRSLSGVLTNLERKMYGVSARGNTLFPVRRIDNFTNSMGKADRATQRTNRTLKKTGTILTRVTSKFKKFSTKALGMRTLLTGAVAGGAVLFPTKSAMKFESVMADVGKAINNITPKQLALLSKQVKSSALSMARLPSNVGTIAEAAGKLNIPLDQMKKFMDLVTKSAVAFDVLDETAGMNIGNIKTRLKLTIDEVGSLMDSVNFLADNTNAQGGRMIQIINRLSGEFLEFKAIGMPLELIAGWAAFADRIEVTPQLAASGLRMVITKMKLFPGMMEKIVEDPNKAMIGFLKKFSNVPIVKRPELFKKIFGPLAGKFAMKAINNLELLDETMAKASDTAQSSGSMMRELQRKMNTATFKVDQMRSAFTLLNIAIGNMTLPFIKMLAPHFIKLSVATEKFVDAHPKITKTVLAFGALVAVGMGLLLIAGAIAAAIAFLLPVFSSLSTVIGALMVPFGLLIAMAGVMVYVFGGPLTILIALAAAADYLHKKFGILNPAFEMFLNLEKKIKSINVLDNIKSGIESAKNLVGFGTNIVAQKELVTKGAINGSIKVSASEGSTVEDAEMFSDMPGNLGFNMVGAH